MQETININDIYDKNINFLIGSGASVGLFPTLQLGIKGPDGKASTIESLATHFEKNESRVGQALLFMHYYKTCIDPVLKFKIDAIDTKDGGEVINNYQIFLESILSILLRRKVNERRCNIFTTNYDGCLPFVADRLLESGSLDFVVNDGTRGFMKRHLQSRNFNSYLIHTGVFDRHHASLPQVNLINLHGSAYWRKHGEGIIVDYAEPVDPGVSIDKHEATLTPFSNALLNKDFTWDNINQNGLEQDEISGFWASYNKIPIVNPTKWKFYETVFEEHYYQMLRYLSYELEKDNSTLITFGFSFADEHILNLIKRSLANPTLIVFVCCFSKNSAEHLSSVFRLFRNVKIVSVGDGKLDFSKFNNSVFDLSKIKDPCFSEVKSIIPEGK